MDRIGDAFVWPFRDPEWFSKIVVMGLILLIPIVGGINGLGWMLTMIDRLREGDDRRLPPANFDYLGRGVQLFVVNLAYYFIFALIAAAFYVPAILLLSSQGHDSPNGVIVALGVGLLLITISVVTLGSLVLIFTMPSIVLAVDHGGVEGGFRLGEVLRRASASLTNTLIAGLMLIAAGFVSELGFVACFIGIVFTTAYALAMQAWIIRSFELGSSTAAG